MGAGVLGTEGCCRVQCAAIGSMLPFSSLLTSLFTCSALTPRSLPTPNSALSPPNSPGYISALDKKGKDGESVLSKLQRDAQNIAVEHLKGIHTQVLKGLLFNRTSICSCAPPPTPGAAAVMEH